MRAAGAVHFYRAFGLSIRSEIELPQLPVADANGAPDLTIALGEVEPGIVHSQLGYRRGKMFSDFRYEATAGREVVIDPLPGSAANNIADGIMSRVLTIVAYQRGLLPLHASAVAIGDKVLAVCGPSGAGKSTLAALIVARGGRIVADDMLVLTEAGADAWPGAAGLKLSPGSLARIGQTPAGLALANEAEGKYFLPLSVEATGAPARIGTLIRLEEGAPGARRLSRQQAIAQWQHCVRQPDLVETAPDPSALWRRWIELVASVEMLAVAHGRQMGALDDILDQLLGNEAQERRQYG